MPSILAAAQTDLKPAPKIIPIPPKTQRVCIDLPGEDFSCYVTEPNVEIMLRKHRDIVFDLQLFNGMSYTVESDQSDFYNARDKKLVEFRKKQKVVFKDGERLHLWVGREFKGSLILKANGKALGRYQPGRIDATMYDAEPATKPAPLLVTMNNGAAGGLVRPSTNREINFLSTGGHPEPEVYGYSPLQFSQAKAEDESAQDMHVVEIQPGADVPKQVSDFFKNGGEQTALDSSGILTRNWLWIQIVGGLSYLSDNKPWIKELWQEKFYLQRIRHKAGEKVYIVFKGRPALRKFLNGTRYATTHAKVLAITAGAGTVVGLRHAAWEGAKGAVKKGGALTVIFATVINIAEWLADYEQRDPATGKPKKDFFDLVFKIGVDVAKAVVSAVIGSLVIGLVVMGAATVGVALTGAAIVVGTIAAAVIIGVGLDWLDKKSGATDGVNKAIRESAQYLSGKIPVDYSRYVDSLGKTFDHAGRL